MAKSRSRSRPVAGRSDASQVKTAEHDSPEDAGPSNVPSEHEPHNDAAEMERELQRLHDAGLRGASWVQNLREGERFTAWLAERGCSPDQIRAVADRDRSGSPKVPPLLLVAYLAHATTTRSLSVRSSQVTLSRLLVWFRVNDWAVPNLRSDPSAREEYAAVRNFLATYHYDDPERLTKVRARPTDRLEAIEAISTAIASSREVAGIAPLWVEAMLTFHLFITNVGFRGGESVNKLRWSWLELGESELLVHVPGRALKHHPDARTLPTPCPDAGRKCQRTGLCALHQMARWRAHCEREGVPTGPNDLVFPYIRPTASKPSAAAPDRTTRGLVAAEASPEALPAVNRGGRPWVANPVEEAGMVARQLGRSEDEIAKVEADAAGNHYKRYAEPWVRFAQLAGFEPRHRFEKVASHSARRGVATRFHRNGASLVHIAFQLCQTNPTSAAVYVDTTDDETPDFAPLFDLSRIGRDDQLHLADVLTFGEIAEVTNTCGATTSNSSCDLPSAGTVELDGAALGLCRAHLRRFFRGDRGFALMRPIPPQNLPESRTCELMLASGRCGRERTSVGLLAGTWVALCQTHYKRYVVGLTGDDIKQEWRPPLDHACRVVHHGQECGRGVIGQHRVDDEWVSMCSGHKQRWANGKRGDAFTRPIRKEQQRCPSPTCEVAHDGVPCGRPVKCAIEVDCGRVSACTVHYNRWREGKRGDAFTAPVREQATLHETCEVEHKGQACGLSSRGFVHSGRQRLSVCGAHRARWNAGKRGEEFEAPIRTMRREKLQRACEVTHDHRPCGRERHGGIEIDRVLVAACRGHFRRWHEGKRGDAFTAPIRTRSTTTG